MRHGNKIKLVLWTSSKIYQQNGKILSWIGICTHSPRNSPGILLNAHRTKYFFQGPESSTWKTTHQNNRVSINLNFANFIIYENAIIQRITGTWKCSVDKCT